MRPGRWQENLTAGQFGLISQHVITSKPILHLVNELNFSFFILFSFFFFFAALQTKSKYVDWSSSASVQGYHFIYLDNKHDISVLFCSVIISF